MPSGQARGWGDGQRQTRAGRQQQQQGRLCQGWAAGQSHTGSCWGACACAGQQGWHVQRAQPLAPCLHCRRLWVIRQELQGVPIMALTATASQRVQDDICQQLRLRNPLRLVSTFNRPNISYQGGRCFACALCTPLRVVSQQPPWCAQCLPGLALASGTTAACALGPVHYHAWAPWSCDPRLDQQAVVMSPTNALQPLAPLTPRCSAVCGHDAGPQQHRPPHRPPARPGGAAGTGADGQPRRARALLCSGEQQQQQGGGLWLLGVLEWQECRQLGKGA